MNAASSTPRIAMFLGAGASKAFGGPLTAEILPTIMEGMRSRTLFEGPGGEESRQNLNRFLNELMPGIGLIDQRHVLVTEILSLIDYMLLSAFVPSPRARTEELHTCRMLLERAILEVLEWPYDPGNAEEAPADLKRLARWMYDLGHRSALGIISTNYDETVETELYRCFISGSDQARSFDSVNQAVNFGLSWRDCPSGKVFNPPGDARHAVLKLHGSADWMKCELCGWIICNDTYAFQTKNYHRESYGLQAEHNTCYCGHWPLRSVIIAPSLVRDIRDINILSIWKAAFEELRVADRWFMIGYSLPVEDYAIRSMLIRALKSRKSPPQIEVYQWGDSPETEARYRAFFGGECVYHKSGMQGFIQDVVDSQMFLG